MNLSVSQWAGECFFFVAWQLKTQPNCWSSSSSDFITSCRRLKDCLSLMAERRPDSLISFPAHFLFLSCSVLFPLFFSAVCSYLFLPHCSLITPLPFSQSFLIRLFKFLKPVSLFHNSWYAILQPLPSPNLIFTGFVPLHNISFCPSYLLSCPSPSLQINLSFFLFHCFSATFSFLFFLPGWEIDP